MLTGGGVQILRRKHSHSFSPYKGKMLGHADISTTMKYYIKFVEEKGKKRATFLDNIFPKNCTIIAHLMVFRFNV